MRRPFITGRRVGGPILAGIAALGVFFVHFRPWQGGLLEDWGLALAWDNEGMGGFAARIPATLGRPFELVPHYVGMALSDGGFVGPYAVLGVIALAQLAAALWAVGPLTPSRPLQWAAALAIAVHPWWAPGDILRFMPAQVAVLGVVLWSGAAVRFMASGRRVLVPILVLAPMLGLLAYQAPAAALVLGACLIALMSAATWRRRAALLLLAFGTALAVLLWSVVVAPRLSPSTYESQLIASSIDPVASIRSIARTIALHSPWIACTAAIIALAVIGLGFSQRLSASHAWLLLAGIASAPLAALTYASQTLHLNDPERVALPVGIVLWLVLCCTLPALSGDRTWRLLSTALILVGTTTGALVGYGTWTGYASSQEALIDAVQTVREGLPVDHELVVADESGRFGDVYLLLPPHLNFALDVEYGPGADATLCTPAGVQRRQPRAALFPISTTPDCSTLLDGVAATPLGSRATPYGALDMYELAPAK